MRYLFNINNWAKTLCAAAVIAVSLFVFAVSIAAAWENLRYARANEQILTVISMAREMSFSQNTSAEQALKSLSDRLSYKYREIARKDNANKSLYIGNPWGDELEIGIFPSSSFVKMETVLSSHICRKISHFLGKNADSLGLVKMEIKSPNHFFSSDGIVYQKSMEDKNNKSFNQVFVEKFCRDTGQVTLSLIFDL